MKFRIAAILLVCNATLAGCASDQQPFDGTPNTFISAKAEAISDRLSLSCIEGGGRIAEQSKSHIVCAKPFDGSFGALMYRALLTEGSTASNPEVNVQTTWAKEGNGYRLAARSWVEHQNAFGKTTRNYLEAPNIKRELQAGLERIRDRLTP